MSQKKHHGGLKFELENRPANGTEGSAEWVETMPYLLYSALHMRPK